MNLSRKCCRWVGVVLIMLIEITTGSSVAQAGSEGISSASRGPDGDAGAKKWASPSKAATVKPAPLKSVVVSATETSEQAVNVEKSGSLEKIEKAEQNEKVNGRS